MDIIRLFEAAKTRSALSSALKRIVKLREERASHALHSLAYLQNSCFDPRQLRCFAFTVTSFCLSSFSAHASWKETPPFQRRRKNSSSSNLG